MYSTTCKTETAERENKMSQKFEDVWDEVGEALATAKGIAFDTCHKIYILMDDAQMELMREYEYDPLIPASEMKPAEMLATIKKWYEDSCALRFVQAVTTNEEDPNKGFESLIPQGYESEFCVSCGEHGVDFDGYCDDCREDWDEEDEDEDE